MSKESLQAIEEAIKEHVRLEELHGAVLINWQIGYELVRPDGGFLINYAGHPHGSATSAMGLAGAVVGLVTDDIMDPGDPEDS